MSAVTTNVVTTTLIAKASLGDWVKALKVAGTGIGTRPPVPVLAGVLIESKTHRVTVSGFDYESYGVAVLGAAVAPNDVRVLLHHKTLLDIIVGLGKRATKRISDVWDVSLTLTANGVVVECQGAIFNVATMPIDEYPTLPLHKDGIVYGVKAATFVRRMDSALISASKDDTLPILTGVKMEASAGTLSLLTTDRYRLTMADLPVYDSAEDATALIGAKVWKRFKKVLNAKGSDIRIEFYMDDRWTVFEQDGVVVGVLNTDGDYPRIRSLFPDSTEIAFEMDADALAAAVSSVAVVAERNTPVRFTYNGLDSLRIDAGTGEDAQAQSFLPYSSPRGNRGFAVCFNPHYISEVLKDLKGQRVLIQHTTAQKPAAIQGVDAPDVRHLVMPVRLPS